MFKYFYNLRGGRDEAPDAESVPLGAGEAEALVEERVTEQVLAGLPHNLRLDTTCLPSPSPLVPQIDPSVPQPVVQSRRRPLLGPSPG